MIKFAALIGQEQKVIIYFQNELLLNRPGCSANPPGKEGKILIGEIIMTQIDLRSRIKPTERWTRDLTFLAGYSTRKDRENILRNQVNIKQAKKL